MALGEAQLARTERSVRENVGGGWGGIDRDVMTDYQQKRFGVDPEMHLDAKTSIAARSRNAFKVQTVVRR
jgi:hypothetical protein